MLRGSAGQRRLSVLEESTSSEVQFVRLPTRRERCGA